MNDWKTQLKSAGEEVWEWQHKYWSDQINEYISKTLIAHGHVRYQYNQI